MFSEKELTNMTAEEVHRAFELLKSGKSTAEIRAAVLPRKQEPETADDVGIELVKRMISARQRPDCRSFLEKWHK